MKRYFIFGFLTILIITLNFAFIIVLVSENVRINYDVLFLMWVVVILAAAGLAYLEKTKHTRSTSAASNPNSTGSFFTIENTSSKAPMVYTHKDIKKYKIILPSDLVPTIQPGFFSGYIITEEYAQEKVQAVYTKDKQLLGYLNKKKRRLCHNIEQLYKEPILTWGEIKWDEPKKTYKVKGYVPILYNQREMNRFRKLAKLKSELLEFDNAPETYNIFSYLEKAEKFQYLQQSEIPAPSLDYEVEPEIMQVLCQKLVTEQRWEDILRFKDYPILVNRLSQPQKKELLQAIKKAEKELVSS